MRQTIRIILLFGITLSIFSCKSEPVEDLPLETQTGNNTFGCKVDGALFVSHSDIAPAGKQALSATYYKEADLLTIEAYSKNQSNSFQKIFLALCHPTVNSNLPFANIAIYNPQIDNNIQYQGFTTFIWDFSYDEKDNKMNLIKFDTLQHIVSGSFYFTGLCTDGYIPVDTTNKQIKEGRFDIEMGTRYDQVNEILISDQLPNSKIGTTLKINEFAIIRSQADLEKLFTTDYIDKTTVLQDIDFSQNCLLLGHLSTPNTPIVKMESKLLKLNQNLYLYRIAVYQGFLTTPTGSYHGIIAKKLPDNATIVVDVIQKSIIDKS